VPKSTNKSNLETIEIPESLKKQGIKQVIIQELPEEVSVPLAKLITIFFKKELISWLQKKNKV